MSENGVDPIRDRYLTLDSALQIKFYIDKYICKVCVARICRLPNYFGVCSLQLLVEL
jgi:hypothetical protein